MKKLKLLTITLAIILIALVAFVGVYMQEQNRMENQVRGYSYGMDLSGTRNVRLSLDEGTTTVIKDSEGKEVTDADELTDEELTEKGYKKEETVKNSEEVKTAENYKTAKNIIQKRLQKWGVDDYTVKLDEQNGDIVIEIPETEMTDTVVTQLATMGKFEITDSETGKVLIDNSDIQKVNVLYGQSSNSTTAGTNVYISIQFTKEGVKKLEEVSTEYVTVESSNTDSEDSANAENTDVESTDIEAENTDTANTETKQKQVSIKIDDVAITTTSFAEPLRTGSLPLTVGTATTDQATLQEYAKQASLMSAVLDTGRVPVKYEVSGNEYIASDITNKELTIAACVIAAVAVAGLIVLVAKYKMEGLLVALAYVGQAALLLLLIRYANVVLTIEGIAGIVIVLLLNYIFVNNLLAKLKGKELNKETIETSTKETYKEFFIKIIPVCILTVVFCFINWVPISSFGMVMFWGIALIAAYNIIVTSNLLKMNAE